MKWVRGASLAFAGPVVVIVGGIEWGPLMEWDLTQPQATLIAGFVAGPFLITAAYIAFHGQRENMKIERKKFDEQIKLQKDQARDELNLRRDQWVAEQRLTNARNVRDRDSALFARMLSFYAEFARALGRTRRAIPLLPGGYSDGEWAAVEAHLCEMVAASNSINDFASELRLAGYILPETGLNRTHNAMRQARATVERAVRDRLQDAELRAATDEDIDKFSTAFSTLTTWAATSMAVRDDDVIALADALEVVGRTPSD